MSIEEEAQFLEQFREKAEEKKGRCWTSTKYGLHMRKKRATALGVRKCTVYFIGMVGVKLCPGANIQRGQVKRSLRPQKN